MKHKKSEHIENLKFCTNYKEGKCPYSEKCWFIHDNKDISKEGNMNHEKTIEKLVGIVEKFTKKVVSIEDIVMKNNWKDKKEKKKRNKKAKKME